MLKSIHNRQFWIMILLITTRLLLDISYTSLVEPLFGYWGYENNPTTGSMIFSWVYFAAGTLLILPYFKYEGYVVSNCVIMLYLIGFLPTTSFLAYNPQPLPYLIANSTYWLLFFFITRVIRAPKIIFKPVPESAILLIGLFFSLVVIYISGRYVSFRFTISLANVYDLRDEARGFDVPLILEYLWSASKVVLPIFVAYYLVKKKYLLATFFIFVILLNFSIDGVKSVLFSLIICLLLFFFVKKDIRSYYPVLIILLLGLSLLEYNVFSTGFINDSLVRRNFIVPTHLDIKYFEVANQFGPCFWDYNINGKNVAFYIGDYFFDRPDMRANNGMFSDAYINLGFIGCIVYPLIYGLMFQTADYVLRKANKGITLLICFMWAYKMRGAIFTTVLLTHGIAISILVLSIMPIFERNNSKVYKRIN